jgi:hypothetical protein
MVGSMVSLWWMAAVLAPAANGAMSDDACPNEPSEICEWSDRFTSFEAVHARVAPDGVLVFRFERGGLGLVDDAEALTFANVTVTADGQSIGGTLELVDGVDAHALWRPETPLSARADVQASVTIDNDGLAYDGSPCNLVDDPSADFEVTDAPIAPLPLPAYVFETTPYQFASPDLEAMLCCDGAMPTQPDRRECAPPSDPRWEEGLCAYTRHHGYAVGTFRITDALPEELASRVVYRLRVDEEVESTYAGFSQTLETLRDVAWWASFEMVDLATGVAIESRPHFADAAGSAPLGEHDVDARTELVMACEGEPYACDAIEDESGRRWDAERCDPSQDLLGGSTDGSTGGSADGSADGSTDGSHAAGDDRQGCACSMTGPSSFAWSWLLLAPMWRRRTARTSRGGSAMLGGRVENARSTERHIEFRELVRAAAGCLGARRRRGRGGQAARHRSPRGSRSELPGPGGAI